MVSAVHSSTAAVQQQAVAAQTKAPAPQQNAVPQDTVTLSRQAQAQQAPAGDRDGDSK